MFSRCVMRDYSIQIFYDASDDKRTKFRATSVFQCEAESIDQAYKLAVDSLGDKYTLGAILPGKFLRFP